MTSLRAQLTAQALIGGLLLLGVIGFALDWSLSRALVSQFDEALCVTARSMATLTEEGSVGFEFEFEGPTMPDFERTGGREVFLVTRADGPEVRRSKSLGFASLSGVMGTVDQPAIFDAHLPNGRSLRCASLRFLPRDEDAPSVGPPLPPAAKHELVLVFGRDRRPLDSLLARIRWTLVLVSGAALGALGWVIRWGVRGALAPVDRLSQTLASIDSATLGARLSPDALPMELQPVAKRVNELLNRLESAFARERRFTATAAHEFRTPLAELRALAEVNLTVPASETERFESWQDALGTVRRMERLGSVLLDLARTEDPGRALNPEPVQISGAIRIAGKEAQQLAERRGVQFATEVPDDWTIHTDPTLLDAILRNLAENAARHAPSRCTVKIFTRGVGFARELVFSNPCGDLTAADLPHLFERFWRKEASRAEAHHHGLGLALAADFAALLRGSLRAELETDQLQFALRLANLKTV